MRQTEGINQTRKSKLLNGEERIRIETLQREGLSKARIGKRICRPARRRGIRIDFRWSFSGTGDRRRFCADHWSGAVRRRADGVRRHRGAEGVFCAAAREAALRAALPAPSCI